VTLDNTRDWSIGVVIPAQNEEASIEACVGSVRRACEYSGCRDSLWIVVVADTCTDRTANLARGAIGSFGEVIEARVRSAGSARRLGAKAVVDHFCTIDPRSIWLANTDADTCVSRDWIDVQLNLANDGITGVAGIVRLGHESSAAAHEVHRRNYPLGTDGTHTHVHGANIAVRADAYLDVGGWKDRALAEEHCLWGRLRSRGWRISSPTNSVVTTSGRLEGRAPGGFADTLKARLDARHADS
jgi:cellulose synthase/poly-beta-1,6-N-acetylglucosamine synthase-like glycosyltransferase